MLAYKFIAIQVYIYVQLCSIAFIHLFTNIIETTLFTNLTIQFVISTQEVTRYSIHNPQLLIFSPQICHTFGFRVSAYSANSHFISP